MKPAVLTFALSGLFVLGGCSQLQRDTQTRTTAPPAQPVQTGMADSTIPAGTEVAVRANEDISANEPGRTYAAEVAQTIVNANGQTLIPQGSPAELVVVQTNEGGATGTPTIALAVQSVTVNGERRLVSTANVEQRGAEGLGANRRTAEMVGGGAALGTLIGAIAGGGSGAAVGAAVGAAGGAAAQVLTRGDEVRVPAETVLTFRLDEPWRLEG